MNIFEKFKFGLNKSSNKFSLGFRDIFEKKNIDNETLEKFEELLIEADVGVEFSSNLKKRFKKIKIEKKIQEPRNFKNFSRATFSRFIKIRKKLIWFWEQ